MYIYIYIVWARARRSLQGRVPPPGVLLGATRREGDAPFLGIHHRGVQWEGGAVDWGSII